ncbi:MAG TPA: folate-binding protein [Opitutaceae bacterium]|nr:folate-binding protein [Opitutaceae bacterium]
MAKFPESAAVFRYFPACLLRVSGPDAATFLQGQFTNDLSKIEPGRAVYGLWLDRKGRVIADSHVVRAADEAGFWIASVSSPAPVVARRLGDYIVADDVAIEDATAGRLGLSLIGAGAGAWLAGEPRAGLFFPGRRDSGESWEWIYPAGDSDTVDAAISGARTASSGEMERMRIASGIPSIPADIGPSDLPNEGGLESQAVSYSKGCYLGQEVMARLKSMGRVRRALVRVRGDGAPPPVPAALWSGGRREGELRSAVADAGERGFAGLALVSAASAAGGRPLSLAAGGPPSIEIVPKS